jgi:glutamate synthase domain-containing protein 3
MVEIDASGLSVREVNTRLRDAAEQGSEMIVLHHPAAQHNIGVGLVHPVKLTIKGSGGYFCMGLCDGPEVDVEGNVGWAFADNLLAGRMVVTGNAGAVCGVGMRDGELLIRGNIGSRAGQVMKGGAIVCCGRAGFRAGSMMMGGRLVILGDAEQNVGEFIMDGEIFVAGKIANLGEDAVQTDLQPHDGEQLDQLLDRLGVKPPKPTGQFTKIISDQRALRYKEYEKGELLFDDAQEKKAQVVAADGNRDVMTFDSD